MTEASASEGRVIHGEVGGGMSAESLAGIAGIVLGILALLGVAPRALCSVALIAFGAGLLFGSVVKGRFASLHSAHSGFGETTRRIIDESIRASAGGEVLVGVGAVVLGILALLGLNSVTLVLIGFLGVGTALLLSGTAFGARMLGLFHHAHSAH
jgi:hypothetical protein